MSTEPESQLPQEPALPTSTFVADELNRYINGVYKDIVLTQKERDVIEAAFYAAFSVAYVEIVYKNASRSDEEASKILTGIHHEMQTFARRRRAEIAVDKAFKEVRAGQKPGDAN